MLQRPAQAERPSGPPLRCSLPTAGSHVASWRTMKITALRVLQVRGELPFEGEFWEERLVRPLDLYPQHRTDPPGRLARNERGHYRMESIFLRIETDEGVYGVGGPITEEQAYIIQRQLAGLLLGQDPLAIELLWDRLYRAQVHGRKGPPMMALSAIDCALWDLKGRWLGQPVYRLLGGPTRDSVPAYASMLGFAVQDMGRVRARAQEYKDLGYRAQKWFFRHGPMSGAEGLRTNVDLVRTLRETLGDDYDIMLDCWQAFDPVYTTDLAERIAEYRPRWLEECVMPDRIDSYVRVKERTN